MKSEMLKIKKGMTGQDIQDEIFMKMSPDKKNQTYERFYDFFEGT